MKLSIFASGLVLAAATMVSNASATQIKCGGADFDVTRTTSTGASQIYRNLGGITNESTTATVDVIGCADRVGGYAGEHAVVDFYCESTQTINCMLHAEPSNGAGYATSTSTTGSGYFSSSVATLSSSKAPSTFTTAILCSLPPRCSIKGALKY